MSKKNSKTNEPTEQQKRHTELLQMKKQDPAKLKDDIFRLREQLREMIANKQELQDQIEENRRQYTSETFAIETQLKQQEEALIEIEDELNCKKREYQSNVIALKRSHEEKQEANEQKKAKELQQKRIQRTKLREKVEYLENYPERKKKYEVLHEELRKQLEKMEKQQEKDIGNIKSQYQKEREKIENDTAQEMEKIKETEVSRLEKKMTREQYIKKENEVMLTEIALCEEQKSVLETEIKELTTQIEVDKLKQCDSVLGSQANQTYERSLRIIKLEGKLSKLKTYLSEQTLKLEKEYSEIDGVYTKQFQEVELKISKAEGWLRMKERDLKKVKACAQMVLNQRSNLESYLLEVFYEHPEVDPKDERNINKILRFLFAKINSRKPPVTYRHYLQQQHNSVSSSSSQL